MAFQAAKSGFSLEDLTRMGPDEITRKRKIAEALLAQSQGIHPIANPLEGMAQMAQALIGNLKGAYLDRKEREGKSDANALFSAGMGMGEFPPAPGAKAAPSGSASSGSGMRGDDIAWKDATPEQRAFLNTLAGPESGGRYNVIYGGGRFNDFSHHPGQSVRIQTGPNAGRTSSAAGKYQFLGETWKGVAAEIGLPDFSPESQDKGAWHLADKTFKAKTGQDLLTVLKSGDPKAIAAAGSTLRDVWTSLPGGIEQGTNQDRFVASYQKYLGQGASPAQAQAAATQETGAPAPKGPVQVASNDPAIGVQQAMVEQGQDPNDPLSQALVKLKQNNPDGSTAPVVPLPDQAAIGAALTGARPSAAVGSVPPLPTPAAQVPMPAPPGAPAAQAPLPQQQQMAQALIQPQDPAQTLGAPAISPQGPDMRTLMNMAGNEFMSPQQQKMIEALTGQRMKQADPEYQMGLEKSRLELDALKNPKMSPSQQAEYDLNVQKFGVEQADRIAKQADTDADNKRADAELDLKRKEGLTTGNIKDYEAYKRDEVNAGRTPLGRLEYEQELRKSGASSTNVDISGGTGKQVFDAVAASAEKATQAAAGFNAVMEANKALDAGIISGSGADMRLGLQKLGAFFGADPTTIQNTETFRSAIAPQIAAVMKATVGNVQISDADREFAEKAAGGSIALEAGSIKRLMKIMEKMSRATIDRHQKILDKVYPETPDGKFDRERALFGIDPLPETAPPNAPIVRDGYTIVPRP